MPTHTDTHSHTDTHTHTQKMKESKINCSVTSPAAGSSGHHQASSREANQQTKRADEHVLVHLRHTHPSTHRHPHTPTETTCTRTCTHTKQNQKAKQNLDHHQQKGECKAHKTCMHTGTTTLTHTHTQQHGTCAPEPANRFLQKSKHSQKHKTTPTFLHTQTQKS